MNLSSIYQNRIKEIIYKLDLSIPNHKEHILTMSIVNMELKLYYKSEFSIAEAWFKDSQIIFSLDKT